MQNDNSTALS